MYGAAIVWCPFAVRIPQHRGVTCSTRRAEAIRAKVIYLYMYLSLSLSLPLSLSIYIYIYIYDI